MTVTDTTNTNTHAGNAASPGANEVNPHYLDHVMNVSDTHGVEASEDIVARNGMKLLAKGARIDASVRERLLEHKLIKPLEQCMQVADGVTLPQLQEVARDLVEESPLVASLCDAPGTRGHALDTLRSMPLGGPLQSLLTVYHGAGPDKLRHALSVALMSVSLAHRLGKQGSGKATAVQMLQAGLCHDVGELYIEPTFLQAGHKLDAAQWKHVAAHPIVGWRVLKSLPGMGTAVADLVMDHHERLDGFGYPRGRGGANLSVDSQILALGELLAGLEDNTGDVPLMRADVAVKLVPGEFSRPLIDVVDKTVRLHKAARPAIECGELPPFAEMMRKAEHTATDLRRLSEARDVLDLELAEASPPFKSLIAQAMARLESLQKGLSSTGLDAHEPEELRRRLLQLADRPEDGVHLEVSMILKEIGWRLRELEREVTARAERLAPADLPRLFRLMAHLKGSHSGTPPSANAG